MSIAIQRIERAIADMQKGGMQTGKQTIKLEYSDAQRAIAELTDIKRRNAELVARNLEKLNNCLDALQIANKRIEKLESYNIALANESHNKSNMIDYERSKNAESTRNGFIAGYHKMHIDFVGSLAPKESTEFAADQYAAKIAGGAE